MDFVIHSMGMPFNGETIQKRSLGGSESAAYYLAKELARRGHRVSVFTNEREEGEWDGVKYLWCGEAGQNAPLGERYHFYAENTPHDVTIVQRHPQAFTRPPASKVRIWQLHDLALYRSMAGVQQMLCHMDFVTTVSEFHKNQVSEVYGINPEGIKVVRNGVDPELYANQLAQHMPGPFNMLYQSRPERGLEHLLREGGIMEVLAQRESQAHLYICAYENTVPQMAGYYQHLQGRAAALPNVTWLGALTKHELASLQLSCDVLCYPTEFEEVSCITAMEAMHAGLPFLSSKHAALPETCRGAGAILVPLKDGTADEAAFVRHILNLEDSVLGGGERHAELVQKQLRAAPTRTWEQATTELEEAIQDTFDSVTATTKLRRLIDLSDIGAANHLLRRLAVSRTEPTGAIFQMAKREVADLYAFTESPEAFAAHYAKHQDDDYYGRMTEAELRADVTRQSRYIGVQSLLAAHISALPEGRKAAVLDLGCAHGHFTVPLAKTFPQAAFYGLDISKKAIGAAMRWATDERLDLNLAAGTLEDRPWPDVKWDVIIAAEVVEHQLDYEAFLNAAMARLKDDGILIITTPTGPWERIGYRKPGNENGRQHLHHFERQDWYDLAGHLPGFEIMCAPTDARFLGDPCGSLVVKFGLGELGAIDYNRKLSQVSGRQTISACMIVKDGADTVVTSLNSIREVVDEVIVAVDPNTTDDTVAVINRWADSIPWVPVKVIDGVAALAEGFDEARNLSIKQASGDWIWWMDADEQVVGTDAIAVLARNNPHWGYGLPQIHYSADPPQVLTTDYPTRLFRNHRGIRFYGVVHEHPEIEIGKAVPWAVARNDCRIVHGGYITEEVRRKRYMRNLPLLERDMAKHPDRTLNKFLYLRDLAQGIGFERQAGIANPLQHQRAAVGVRLFEDLLASDHIRMIIDSLPFYSICVDVLGGGFEAAARVGASKMNGGIDLATSPEVRGLFLKPDHWLKLTSKLTKESIKHYESPHF